MHTLLLVASIVTLILGIYLWISKSKLFVAGPWIINNSLFVLIVILQPGFCVSMFYIGIGLYITMYYLNYYTLNKVCWFLVGLCVFEIVFTNSLQFIDWPFMSNNVTFIKTNMMIIMIIPGYKKVLSLLAASKAQVSNYYSKINFEFYNWLKGLLYFTFFTCGISLLTVFAHIWIEPIPSSDGFILSVLVCTNLYLFFICYVQYSPQFKLCVIDKQTILDTQGIKKEDRILQSLMQWNKLVDEKQLFLDSNLTLPKLAEQLQIHPKTFSGMINQHYEMSFHEYINRKRIDTAKERLIDPAYGNLTITAIGLESGFSSRSTFYSTFKKFVGCTPKQFAEKTSHQFNQQMIIQ